MTATLTARNIGFQEFADLLGEQQVRKLDVVVKATDLSATPEGLIQVSNHEPVLSDLGVTEVNGDYQPGDVFQEHLSSTLKMDARYTKRTHADRPDIWAANVNGWLHGNTWGPMVEPEHKPDERSFLLRAYTDKGDPNVARALLSDRYGIIDNFDVLTATIAGINEAGIIGLAVAGADLTERRMFVRFLAPTVAVGAQALLDGYRSPFGQPGVQRAGSLAFNPSIQRAAELADRYHDGLVLWAGFEVTNSEVGGGAYALTPRAEFRVCRNGLKITVDADRSIHLGSKLEHGTIKWSQDTMKKQLALIQAKTRDAVATFLSPDYWEAKVAELAEKAGKPVADAPKVIDNVSRTLGYSKVERDSILNHFILGGQMSAGGVMNAVTSVAQTLPDADRAAELESSAVRVLDVV